MGSSDPDRVVFSGGVCIRCVPVQNRYKERNEMQGLFLTSASRLGLFYDNEPLAVYYILTFVWVCVTKHTPLFWKEKKEKWSNNKDGEEETTSYLEEILRKRASWRRREGQMWQSRRSQVSGVSDLSLAAYPGSFILDQFYWVSSSERGLPETMAWHSRLHGRCWILIGSWAVPATSMLTGHWLRFGRAASKVVQLKQR